jgi:GNAT superfamily N-acetyltransferase
LNLQHHPYSPVGDAGLLEAIRCSTGTDFEEDVEHWIATMAVGLLYDHPKAVFQRRNLHLVEDDYGHHVAVFAWQDIELLAVDGIWLEVLAVSLDFQHRGIGRQVLSLAIDHLREVDHDGETLGAMVHHENRRSLDMLLAAGWVRAANSDGHYVMVSQLG